MVRPRNNDLNASIETRIEEAFWELLENNAPERISVVALSNQAHCNRGTFYYYYTDIFDLLDRLIEKNMPANAPLQLLSFIHGGASAESVKAALYAESEKLQKVGLLLTRSESGYCSEKLKESCLEMWCRSTGISKSSMSKTDLLMFEFVASGILGMLARCGKNREKLTADDLIETLFPEIPNALLARTKRIQDAQK